MCTRPRIVIDVSAIHSLLAKSSYNCDMSARVPKQPLHLSLRIVGIVCVALVLLAGMLSLTHSHSDGAPQNDCGLCTTAHVVVKASQAVTQIATRLSFTRLAASVVVTPPRPRPSDFSLFTRPPPVASSLA